MPRDYPLVAPDYAKVRTRLAKKIGLGVGGRGGGGEISGVNLQVDAGSPTDRLGQRAISGCAAATLGDWLREVADISSLVLDPAVMKKVRRMSLLLTLAEALGWLSNEGLKHGLGPWTAGLASAQDDLTQTGRDRLETFLFALTLSVGGEQAQEVSERSFEYLHGRIINAYLSWPAQRLLQSRLPSAGFFRDWDDGLKLRLAVAQAYVRFDLDPASFGRRLTTIDQISAATCLWCRHSLTGPATTCRSAKFCHRLRLGPEPIYRSASFRTSASRTPAFSS